MKKWYLSINKIAAEEAIRAAVNISKRISHLTIDDKVVKSAITTVAAGTMKAYVYGDMGPFLHRLVDELNDEV